MSDRRDDDAGAIAWPGFVDILSAVIIMFVFFVMITAIVMYILSVEFKKKLESEHDQKVAEMASEQFEDQIKQVLEGNITLDELKSKFEYEVKIDELAEQKQKLERDNKALTYEVDELHDVIDQIKADLSASEEQDTLKQDNSLVILYSKNDITTSEETEEVIVSHMDKYMELHGTTDIKVRIVSADNPNAPTLTVSRELSLARSLNVRNVFLKRKMDTKKIQIEYVEPEEIDGSYNWIKVIFEK